MPTTTLITDQDVITILQKDDEIANDVDAAFTSILDRVPTGALIAWQGDLASYRKWSTDARERVSGGFFAGEWFGVVDDYNAAVNWGARLKLHAKDALAAGGDVPALPDLPDPSTPASADLSMGTDTKILIGLVAIAVILVARKF